MRIYGVDGDIPYRRFTFPDGQPHVELLIEGRLKDPGEPATIEVAIMTPADLFDILLAHDCLWKCGFSPSLDIRYLMGARMDRAINLRSPGTLAAVTDIINTVHWKQVRIFDPHSDVALKYIKAENKCAVYPIELVHRSVVKPNHVIVIPDEGARNRVDVLTRGLSNTRVQAHKHRDSVTGVLSGFSVDEHTKVAGKECLILDDICDGGGTFTGVAMVLRGAGATAVDLFVTHGIFSKGTPLRGIRHIITTDSYFDLTKQTLDGVAVHPIRMSEL